MPTVDYQVGASLDDGRELATGASNTNDASFNVDQANEWVGVRFTGVTIPAGATIDSPSSAAAPASNLLRVSMSSPP